MNSIEPITSDFEVLHAGRIYPDGNPAAEIRERLQRLVREASDRGFVVFVDPDGIRVIRRPEAA